MKRNKTKQNETKKLNPVRDDISVENRLHIKNQSRRDDILVTMDFNRWKNNHHIIKIPLGIKYR